MTCAFQSFSGCLGKEQTPYWPGLSFMAAQADHNQFCCSTAWVLYWFRHPYFFCVSWDPETTMTHLEFCHYSSLESLSERDVSPCSNFLRVQVLCSGVISLSSGQLVEASSPSIHLPISPHKFTTPHLPLCKKQLLFYLQSFRYIFLGLRLNSWMFRMI